MHNLEHHLVKAGYEITLPYEQLFELCEESEMTSIQNVIRVMPKPIETNIRVMATENDSEWRTVLASLYEHGNVMGCILVKHLYESLLGRLQTECCSSELEMVPGKWDFPQLRKAGETMPESAQVSCLFSLKLTDPSDEIVREAIRLVETTTVAHRVFVTTFLNHAAMDSIVRAYETGTAQ